MLDNNFAHIVVGAVNDLIQLSDMIYTWWTRNWLLFEVIVLKLSITRAW